MIDSEKKKELFLLRHGDTGFRGRYIGKTDVGLSNLGRLEIQQVGKDIRKLGFQKILSSPMARCLESLELIDVHGPVEESDLLKEVDFGSWEGKTFSQLADENPKMVEEWVKNPIGFTFPGGESLANFLLRIADISDILYKCEETRILLVTHGGVIRHLLCKLLKLPTENYLIFDVYPGHYCTLNLFKEGGVLTGFNLGR